MTETTERIETKTVTASTDVLLGDLNVLLDDLKLFQPQRTQEKDLERLPPVVVQVIARMRELIQKGWSKGAEARTADGIPVGVSHPEAVRFCLMGAHQRALNDLQNMAWSGWHPEGAALHKLVWDTLQAGIFDYEREHGRMSESGITHSGVCVPRWNDNSFSRGRVLKVLDRILAPYKK